MERNELVSIHDIKSGMPKKVYGSTKRVYRQFQVDLLLDMWRDLHYLSELSTRTKIVPCNEEFKIKKAIPSYNDCVERMKIKYPNIKEFQRYKKIDK